MPLKGNSGTCDHAAHVGEILLGNGRAVLDQQIGYRPKSVTALRRWIFRHASFVYLTGVLLLTIFIYTALYLASNLPGLIGGTTSFSGNFLEAGMPLIPGTPGVLIVVILITFVSLIPVLTVATSLVNWIITLLVKPRILPKLDFRKGIPEPFQTLVVIPAMITSHEEIRFAHSTARTALFAQSGAWFAFCPVD